MNNYFANLWPFNWRQLSAKKSTKQFHKVIFENKKTGLFKVHVFYSSVYPVRPYALKKVFKDKNQALDFFNQ